ncbi:Adenine-specific methyltransferase (plasmid) [Borrelia miyamotoi FR64b]|uniref:Adenine-specific methyltransferase n=1 Tax=Borrelia miyamotoi FR64b TaxID=1292392 RepID=W5SFS8_9SPIR|nr:hypothetical protein [Borrelia miyamotoi]AHH05745.1 Adenine-specific methyltransferase [Borrelia miyamotoi FR64b]WEG95193.1 hypothetical protein EZU70_006960 [Borrelia miyamotoi]
MEYLEKVIRVIYYTIDIKEQIDLIIYNLEEFGYDAELSSVTLAN